MVAPMTTTGQPRRPPVKVLRDLHVGEAFFRPQPALRAAAFAWAEE